MLARVDDDAAFKAAVQAKADQDMAQIASDVEDGIRLARRALRMSPDRTHAFMWLAVSLGPTVLEEDAGATTLVMTEALLRLAEREGSGG